MKHRTTYMIKVQVLGLFLIPFVAGISTISAIKGTAGGPSLVYDMRDSAAAHREYYQDSQQDAGGALGAVAALQPLKTSTCTLAEREGQGGVLSGSAGKGGVYAAFISVCGGVTTIIDTLEETLRRSALRDDEARGVLASMQSVPNDTSRNVFERQAAFRAEADKLYKLIEESGRENVIKRLNAQLETMRASIVSLGVKDGAFGRKQAGAIEGLKSATEKVGSIIAALTAQNGEPPQAPPPLLDMGAAVFAYADKNLPAILIAILVDAIAVWFAAYLMIRAGRIKRLKARIAALRSKADTALASHTIH